MNNPTYIIAGVAVVGLLVLLKNKKKEIVVPEETAAPMPVTPDKVTTDELVKAPVKYRYGLAFVTIGGTTLVVSGFAYLVYKMYKSGITDIPKLKTAARDFYDQSVEKVKNVKLKESIKGRYDKVKDILGPKFETMKKKGGEFYDFMGEKSRVIYGSVRSKLMRDPSMQEEQTPPPSNTITSEQVDKIEKSLPVTSNELEIVEEDPRQETN